MDLRQIFNKLLWDPQYSGQDQSIQITFENRGSPNDEETFTLAQVEKVGKKFLWVQGLTHIEQGMIPLHRIRAIEHLPDHRLYYWNYPKDF